MHDIILIDVPASRLIRRPSFETMRLWKKSAGVVAHRGRHLDQIGEEYNQHGSLHASQ